MSMTKKEKEELEILKIQLALHFTEPVTTDIEPPERFDEIRNGYTINTYSMTILKSCTSSIYHSTCGWNKTTTQGSRPLYSTPILAMRALRNAIERECTEKLRKIDIAIEAELKKGNGEQQ